VCSVVWCMSVCSMSCVLGEFQVCMPSVVCVCASAVL